MTIEKEIAEFERLTRQMSQTFAQKRNDYGQSTTETFEKFGPVSMLTRMHDKMARLDRLLGQNVERAVNGEKVEDTLMDLANYALITIIEIDKQRVKEVANDGQMDRREGRGGSSDCEPF